MSIFSRFLGARRLRKAVGVLATALLVTGMLSAAAAPRSPVAVPVDTSACFHDETGNQECASTQSELRRLVLGKYKKVMVSSHEEFLEILRLGIYESQPVPAGTQATYALGTLFTDANYSGNYITYYTSNSSQCYGSFYSYNFPTIGNNDQASSFYGQGGCQVKLFEHAYYGGVGYGYYDCRSNLANVGYNDVASSVSFFLTTTYSCF